jgi:hypothetical protein
MDYTNLSLEQAKTALEEIGREARATFGALDAGQLNWRPDDTRWSVAQCFDHLLTTNRMMLQAAAEALSDARPRTLWQRVPVLPGMLGRMLVRSQSPDNARKHTTSSVAQPARSDIPADVIDRFARQQQDTALWMEGLDERRAAGAIMVSPLIGVIIYSVLDGCRLIAAHNRRHFEQARRVMQADGFPLPDQPPAAFSPQEMTEPRRS